MKKILLLAAAFALTVFAEPPDSRIDAERAARQIAALEGNYEISFESGTVDGNAYIATDKLTIARASDTAIQFSVRLNFYNGHSCSAGGTADYQPNGEFVYREHFDKLECVLEIVPTGKAILLLDTNGNCKMTSCGMRGSYDHASFSRSLRKPPVKSVAGAR